MAVAPTIEWAIESSIESAMPEGDTIHRHAARLRPVLVGRTVDLVMPRLPRPAPTPVTVTGIDVHGKHLLIDVSDAVIHVHLGMPGRWDLQTPVPRRPPGGRDLRVALTTDTVRATCRRAPVAELLAPDRVSRHPRLARLGPDLADPDVDLDEVVARARSRPPRSLHETLLDQTIAAGLGNVLAMEASHLARQDPRTRVDRLADVDLSTVYALGRRQLVDNITRRRRTTVPGAPPGTLWVSGRDQRPCRRCGTTVVGTSLGQQARHAAWCPSCQPLCAGPP